MEARWATELTELTSMITQLGAYIVKQAAGELMGQANKVAQPAGSIKPVNMGLTPLSQIQAPPKPVVAKTLPAPTSAR